MPPYLRLLRPADWFKNLFVFAPLAFGDRIRDPGADWLAVVAFAAFCLAASAGYILNDIVDRQRDRLHPTKRNRPIASGAIGIPAAIAMLCLLLAGAALICGLCLPGAFSAVLATYLFLTISYSLYLKKRMILDVLILAVLFVLRTLGGAYAIDVPVSHWLLICTFMLCMFLGFGKRRCEIRMIANENDIRQHRPTLVRYTPDLLTHLLSTSAGITVVTFLLYTLDASTPSPFGDRKQNLVYTLPLVVYGIFRYAMLSELETATGPTDLILRDRPMLGTLLLWTAATAAILYLPCFAF
ncbi:MAG TPA: decaprenyl-phosphate phosphoribosyltransferase [Phycisphaerae bacterium]|nr:decaprenyl-phosphate phosphoribosyltransferase [Phycisphaerae bacterium]